MNKFILMSGVAGSGKSTYVANFLKENPDYVSISTDAVRYELFKSYLLTKEQEKIAQTTMDNRIKQAGRDGKNIIFDIAVVSNKSRKRIYNRFKDYFDEFHLIYIDTPLEICYNQNNSRERHVPEDVIKIMYNNREKPNAEILRLFKTIKHIKRKEN